MSRSGSLVLIPFVMVLGGCTSPAQKQVQRLTYDGAHLFRHGSYQNARDCYQTALTIKPEDPDLLYNLGRCHDRMGALADAEKCYKQCLNKAPDHAEARHAWTMLMLRTDRKDVAVQMVQDWLRQRPQLADAYVEDAWLRNWEGDLDSARARYQQALELDPRHPRALKELGALYNKLGRPERALVLYERSLDAQPNQPDIMHLVKDMRAKGVGRPHPE